MNINAIICLFLLFSSAFSWPWIDKPGTLSMSLWGGWIKTDEKYGSGNFTGFNKGDKVPIFESTPGQYSNRTADLYVSFVLIEKIQAGFNLHFASQVWDWDLPRQDDAGFGDSRIFIKYQAAEKIPLVINYTLHLPTGSSRIEAEKISLGKGSFAHGIGLSSGWNVIPNGFIYSQQELIYQAARTQSAERYNTSAGRYETVELGKIKKGGSWQGSISGLYVYGKFKLSSHFEWMVSQEQINTIGKRTEEPGFGYKAVKPEIGYEMGKSMVIFNVSIPFDGIEIPAGPKYQLGYAIKLNLNKRG